MPAVNAGPSSVQTPNSNAVLGAPPTVRSMGAGLNANDQGIIESSDANAVTCVILPVPAGWNIQLIQGGAGQITLAGAPNVTIVNADNQFKTAKQWASVSLYADIDNRVIVAGYTAA